MSLYQHQVEGAAWLAGRARAYLGDRPGLGKTRTIIAALDQSPGCCRPLIVCPAIVRTHWAREFAEIASGSGMRPVVKSYDEIMRGGNALMDYLMREHDALVLDEAHYLKHPAAKRTVQLLGRDGYARRMERVYCASGTPVPKNPSEVWTALSSLFPNVAIEHGLTSMADFKARFCVTRTMRVRGKWVEQILPTVNNADEFRAILGKIMLARTLDDVGLDVPALDWQTMRLDATEPFPHPSVESMVIADALNKGTLADIADEPHIARMRRRLGELKVKPVVEMLTEQLEHSDEKVVIFAHHRAVLHGIYTGLPPGKVLISGDTSPRDRDASIDRFQNDPDCRVFVGQNIACQTGITLTGARRCFLVEPDWTAVVNDQLGHRVARIGQKAERCIAHMICLAGTLDEAIINRNIQEVRMAASIGLGD